MRTYYFLFIIIYFFTVTCNPIHEIQKCQIHLNIKGGVSSTVYLYNVSFDSKRILIDSAFVSKPNQTFTFTIPLNDTLLYEFNTSNRLHHFQFIPDTSSLSLCVNNHSEKYKIVGSQTNELLNIHLDTNYYYTKLINRLLLKKRGNLFGIQEYLDDSIRLASENRYRVDSALLTKVKNPTLFFMIFNAIVTDGSTNFQFGTLKVAANKYRNVAYIQTLYREMLAFKDILETEFKVGDLLPPITLPDKNNIPFSTSVLKGKYYFIDFWATWCPQCLDYDHVKAEAIEKYSNVNFQIVSVAIDNNRDDWKKMIEPYQLRKNWIQLIDEKMWKGNAVNTLKFDSIPFNFLVSPEGIIIDKSIRKTQLLSKLEEILIKK